LKILNTREKEALLEELAERSRVEGKQFKDLVFLESKDEIWVACKQCLMQDFSGFTVESVGMLFARKNKQIELTVNAVQMFYNQTTENTILLDRKESLDFIKALPVAVKKPDGLYIVKHLKNAIDLGCVKKGLLARRNWKP